MQHKIKPYIELNELIIFIKKNIKFIFVFTVFGFLISGSSLLLSGRIYNMKSTIEMGQLNVADSFSLKKERIQDASNFLTIFNSDFSNQKLRVIEKCRTNGGNYSIVVISISRLSLSATGSSYDQLEQCFSAFQNYLEITGHEMLSEYIENLEFVHKINQATISELKDALNKSPNHFSNVISRLSIAEEQNLRIKLVLKNIKNHYSKVLKPYFFNEITFEVAFKRLLIGSLSGLFLGFLYVYIFRRYRV